MASAHAAQRVFEREGPLLMRTTSTAEEAPVFGRDVISAAVWEARAESYAADLYRGDGRGPYHAHRLQVIRALIPKECLRRGARVLDFGCGDGVLFPDFVHGGAEIHGLDVAQAMIDRARQLLTTLGQPAERAQVGGAAEMAALADQSFDAVLSFNVLAYLTDDEERMFYMHAARILRPGGALVVTHSNELFDLYTANALTVRFLQDYLVEPSAHVKIPGLFTAAGEQAEKTRYNVRENPLAYAHKLRRLGFREVRQEFINRHAAPPMLLGERTYPDTLSVPEGERWKLLLTCSTFGSCALRCSDGAGD